MSKVFDTLTSNVYSNYELDSNSVSTDYIRYADNDSNEVHIRRQKTKYHFGFGAMANAAKGIEQANVILNKMMNVLSVIPSSKISVVEVEAEFYLEPTFLPFDALINTNTLVDIADKTNLRLSFRGLAFAAEIDGWEYLLMMYINEGDRHKEKKEEIPYTLLIDKNTNLFETDVITKIYQAALTFEKRLKMLAQTELRQGDNK